jgi:transketolase
MNGLEKIQSQLEDADVFAQYLRTKANWVRTETFKIHRAAPETRVASSLSTVEIFSALYYGKILNFDPKNPYWDGRDRFIISKGHGSISMYPLLADLGFFSKNELSKVCEQGSFLGGIPDPIIPGYETVNGSLGHGVGVACGMAIGLRSSKKNNQVFVVTGDGELNEGSIWEAIMFAGHHKLDNLTIIVDWNKVCMLDYTKQVLSLDPLPEKFSAFGFHVETVDGHDVVACQKSLKALKDLHIGKPKVLIAETVKGKGSPQLEQNSLCHVTALKTAEVDAIIERLNP